MAPASPARRRGKSSGPPVADGVRLPSQPSREDVAFTKPPRSGRSGARKGRRYGDLWNTERCSSDQQVRISTSRRLKGAAATMVTSTDRWPAARRAWIVARPRSSAVRRIRGRLRSLWPRTRCSGGSAMTSRWPATRVCDRRASGRIYAAGPERVGALHRRARPLRRRSASAAPSGAVTRIFSRDGSSLGGRCRS
jgi:hypothetical protein